MNWLKKIAADLPTFDVYDLRRDGKLLFRGTADECFTKLLQVSSSSVAWSIQHEGYTISPILEDWRNYVGNTDFSRL